MPELLLKARFPLDETLHQEQFRVMKAHNEYNQCALYTYTYRSASERMDGWMDEWMDGWIDGWIDDYIDRQKYRQTGKHKAPSEDNEILEDIHCYKRPFYSLLDYCLNSWDDI